MNLEIDDVNEISKWSEDVDCLISKLQKKYFSIIELRTSILEIDISKINWWGKFEYVGEFAEDYQKAIDNYCNNDDFTRQDEMNYNWWSDTFDDVFEAYTNKLWGNYTHYKNWSINEMNEKVFSEYCKLSSRQFIPQTIQAYYLIQVTPDDSKNNIRLTTKLGTFKTRMEYFDNSNKILKWQKNSK